MAIIVDFAGSFLKADFAVVDSTFIVAKGPSKPRDMPGSRAFLALKC